MIRKITPTQPLKILGFTDTHIDNDSDACKWTLRLIRETVEAEKPDLVVFVGDNVSGRPHCRRRIEAFSQTMTNLHVPWCAVLGNHEGEHADDVSRRETAAIFRKSPYCLLPKEAPKTADGRTLFGDTNGMIPLLNADDQICHKLFFFDGGNEMSADDKRRFELENPPRFAYDFLKPEQIDRYKEEVEKSDCPSTVFCHIPLPEYRDAAENGKILSGQKREGICSPLHNSGMFSAMRAQRKPVTFVCGHDHVNDFCALYDGVRLMYNRAGGLSAYNMVSAKLSDISCLGCTVYTVDFDGNLTFTDRFYDDLFPQYRETIYAVLRK